MPNGLIIPDPVRFPHGMDGLAAYMADRGLLFGLYTAQREMTCQLRPGSWRFEAIDIDTYCRWGVAYVKTDACDGRGWSENNVTWIDFRAGIARCEAGAPNRTIVLSVESCSNAACGAWIGGLANLWRTTGDIQATWRSVLSNLDNNNVMAPFAGPGHFNDPGARPAPVRARPARFRARSLRAARARRVRPFSRVALTPCRPLFSRRYASNRRRGIER